MYIKSALSAILATLVLSGCAGSSRSVMMTTEPPPSAIPALGPDDWLVAADAARNQVPGSSTLVMTSDELSKLDESIFSSADTLLYGGFYYTGAEFPGYVLLTDCVKEVCKYGRTGEANTEEAIHDIDFASVMTHKGIRLGQARERFGEGDNPVDITGYGGWMHYNSFVIQVDFLPNLDEPDSVRLSNYSVGLSSGANPVSGTGTWSGVAVGMDLNQMLSKPDVLQGDAEIAYEFGDQSVQVVLDNFTNLATGAALDREMKWSDIAVQDGLFSHGGQFDGEYVHGAFYGSYHEEVGGVFKSGSIAGSFGAPRSDRQ